MSTKPYNQTNRSFLARLLGLSLKISGVHNGDLRANTAVSVPPKSVVIGDIIAPRVEIRGLVRGSIVAREAIVHAGGQVWGNVYARACQVFADGRVYGWMGTVDDADLSAILTQSSTLAELRAAHLLPDAPEGEPVELISGPTKAAAHLSLPDLVFVRRLQQEAATALTDRAELEQAFEQKLAQKAGDLMAEAAALRGNWQLAQSDLQNARQRLESLQATLQTREAELAQETAQRQQLAATVAQQQADAAMLTQALAEAAAAEALLQQHKTDLTTRLQQASAEITELTERAQNLGSAMQASLQHSAEQEEVLIRWQELAEITEAQVKNIQYELQMVQAEQEKQSALAANLREERTELRRQLTQVRAERDALQQVAAALALAQADLSGWQARYTELEQQHQTLQQTHSGLQQELARQAEMQAALADLQASFADMATRAQDLQAERDTLQQQFQEQAQALARQTELAQEHSQWQTAATAAEAQLSDLRTQQTTWQQRLAEVEVQLMQAQLDQDILAHTQSELSALQTQLAGQPQIIAEWQAATARAAESADLVVWYKASLQATQQELAEKGQSLARQQAQIAGMSADLEERTLLVDKWKTNVNRLSELLYTAERRAKKLEAALAQYKEAARTEAEQLSAQVRRYQAQHESNEAELTLLHESVVAQGQQLAWVQATLVERDLALKNLQASADEQKRTLYSVRQVATARIRELEQELAHTKRQLKDLSVWLERRRQRGEDVPPAPSPIEE